MFIYILYCIDSTFIYLYTNICDMLYLFFLFHYNTFFDIIDVMFNTYLYFRQSRSYNLICSCLFSFLIFILIVIVRVSTPRFKFESLSKLG